MRYLTGTYLIFQFKTTWDKLNVIQYTFNESADLSGFAVKNSAEKICVGLCGRKPWS